MDSGHDLKQRDWARSTLFTEDFRTLVGPYYFSTHTLKATARKLLYYTNEPRPAKMHINLEDVTGKLARWHLRFSEIAFFVIHATGNTN